jgi:nucleoside-diphosphate-sugar epimerase
MRIFVAGATGAVGRQLVPLLVEAGHEVSGSSRTLQGAQQLQDQGATAHRLDMFDRDQVLQTVAGVSPQVIVHQLTALSGGSPVDNARIRREGTRNLVDAAHAAQVPRIIAQSISWAYEPGDKPARETVPLDLQAPDPRATSVGGVVALEEAVAEVERYVILRYATLYGPGTWYAPQGYMAQQLRDGRLAANEGVSSFLHVADAARAAVVALDWPNGVYNIADDEPAAASDWVPVLARALGEPVPETSAGRAGWERGADNGAARAQGWVPAHPHWRDGFARQSQ